jgi:hypothetical protein
MAGRPGPSRALLYQLLRYRDIYVTERMDIRAQWRIPLLSSLQASPL